ncbi:MAG: ABC transporter ATP-binding protein [Nostoc sp.]|uniref:ABC transporter ATP-binding protein n=1 Tax=Nostoc sp. TaxID=1180 RepID=UPI002FF9A5F3
MSDTVIRVENLGKKYIIGHQQQERYTALRDVIANKVKSFGNLIQNPKSKIQNSQEEFWALKDVSFEIKQGDRVGIIGRNGAGKSTLLKILSRITEPTQGSIKIKGRVASLLEVGTGFHPELTGRENIYLNGAILGMGKVEIKRKFDEIVAFAEVEKFLDTPVKRYSSGMYVRLAFAVAAHLEPEILIVDEVLAVGDVQFQKKCLGKMDDVSQEGRTVLFVSHNMSSIEFLCSHAMLLNKGKLVKEGTPKNCINYYLSPQQIEKIRAISTYQTINDRKISVLELSINGSSDYNIFISPDNRQLFLKLSIEVTEKRRISIYASLKDRYRQAIGIYSPGHMSHDSIYSCQPSCYQIAATIELPYLVQGTYYLSIALADPGICFHTYIDCIAQLNVLGIVTSSGAVFEQGINEAGYQILNGFTTLVN